MSEHIETLEEIDMEYKELALESGIVNWGRVPALNCEPTFINDLADAVIEALPYVGAMAVSNLEARQVGLQRCLLPLGPNAVKVTHLGPPGLLVFPVTCAFGKCGPVAGYI